MERSREPDQITQRHYVSPVDLSYSGEIWPPFKTGGYIRVIMYLYYFMGSSWKVTGDRKQYKICEKVGQQPVFHESTDDRCNTGDL